MGPEGLENQLVSEKVFCFGDQALFCRIQTLC